MDNKEIVTIILATLVLALAASFKDTSIFYTAVLSFFIIISVNVLTKKAIGHHFETTVKTKFWTWYQFGLRKDMHFKAPIPMIWLPLIITLFSKGHLLWLGILEFDISEKVERAAKRHGIERFTQVTEWHIAWIAIWALAANLIFAITGYIAGAETFAKLSIYFIAWNMVPLARFDGAKIFYASRVLWTIISTITVIVLVLAWGIII